VDGDGQHSLGVVLADHVIVEYSANVAWARHPVARLDQCRLVLLTDNIHAELNAFVTDKHGRTRDQLPDLVLALAAEGAVQRILGVATAGLCHHPSIAGACGPVVDGLTWPLPCPARPRARAASAVSEYLT